MTDKIDLLPLPEDYDDTEGLWEKRYGPYSLEQIEDYARANVARAVEPLQAEIEALQSENKRLWAEVSELRAARIAYANEFPATKDGDPDTGNIHANIRALKVRADKLEKTLRAYQKAVNRIDDLIEYALPMPRETKGALYSVLADLTEELVKESKGNGQKEAQEL